MSGKGLEARAAPNASRQISLPFFYGWLLVVVSFVTMAIGVNARTVFSLLFPQILDEFGWDRGVTAGAFSFGFLVSAVVTPCVGWLTDRRGPRLVIEIGVFLMGTGLVLATLTAALATLPHPRRAGRRRREPSRLYGPITIPHQLVCTAARARAEHCVLGGRCRFDHHFALAANLDRQFGLANCLLVSRAPARRCLAPLNLLLKRRPADLGLEPDGISGSSTPLGARSGTDSSLPSDDWTLGRAVRTPRFRWLATSYFCGLFTWYAVQVHETKYLTEIGFDPSIAAWALVPYERTRYLL